MKTEDILKLIVNADPDKIADGIHHFKEACLKASEAADALQKTVESLGVLQKILKVRKEGG